MAIPILNHLDFQKTAEIQNVLLHTEASGNVTSPGTGQILYDSGTVKFYNGSGWIPLNVRTVTAGGNTLAVTETLAFTAGTGITIGEADGAVTITNSAAAGSSFGTVAVSGQSNVVADQANDTLTFVGAGGMTITTAAGSDTITLTSADNNTTYSVGDGGLTTNDFTNADHSKLNAIEAAADVTDATNVTAAGALMDSEVTNLALVKGLAIGISDGNFLTANDVVVDNDFLRIDGTEVEGLSGTELLAALNVEFGADVTDATNVTAAGALMDSELAGIAAVKATTGTFLTADQTKLDTIETSADVTDTTNVTAAGALMDSELAGLAAVKATTGTFLSADESKLDGIEASADVTDTANVKSALNASFGGSATIGDSSDTFTIPGALTVTGTTTTNNVVTVSTSNGVVFEGPTADGHDGTLISVVAGADVTYTLPNVAGYVGLFAADPGTTTITSTPAELNILDGVTGVTAAELSYVGDVTSAIQAQFSGKQPLDAELTELATMASGTAGALADLSTAEVAILDGATLSTAELNYVDGVTSAIQTQLDATEDASNKVTKKLSGTAEATTYAITHGFGTPIVNVQVLDYGNNGSGATYDVVQVEVQRNDDNNVHLIFASAPGTSQDYLVLVSKFPAIS